MQKIKVAFLARSNAAKDTFIHSAFQISTTTKQENNVCMILHLVEFKGLEFEIWDAQASEGVDFDWKGLCKTVDGIIFICNSHKKSIDFGNKYAGLVKALDLPCLVVSDQRQHTFDAELGNDGGFYYRVWDDASQPKTILENFVDARFSTVEVKVKPKNCCSVI
jgi:hypothetical protein